MNEVRILRAMFYTKNKQGKSEIYTSKMSIPTRWIKDMQITEANRLVYLVLNEEEKTITIGTHENLGEGEATYSRIMLSQSGGTGGYDFGYINARVTLKYKWLEKIGVTPEQREMSVTYDYEEKKIIIKKSE